PATIRENITTTQTTVKSSTTYKSKTMTLKVSAYVVLFPQLTQPPRSTPFPYTTLFRSSPARARSSSRRDAARKDFSPTPPRDALDRKSTRLNSSHDQISYAVFCLKKKRYDMRPM